MGGGRGAASQCHRGLPASTNAADEHGTGWPMRDECDFVAYHLGGVKAYTNRTQKLTTSASIRRQVERKGSGPFV